ncbi:phage tail spike protein [Limosilactobacillus mucosae]|uniref:phage tail spike protein n=1 Tax=Limosilactobacillus mucosae TaxID=97478 RepID=UPI0022E00FA1|nr:phage tail spike protein [Limosilactobacillus mucosae]
MKMFLFDRNQKVKRWLVDRDFIEATMVEQINAADQLTFSVPLNKRLPSSYFYAAIPQPRGSGYLLFKIVTEKVSSDQIEYTAIESAYDELKSYHYIKDVRPENRKAGELLQTALEGTRWQVGQTYDSSTFSINFYYISTLEAIQKIVELCGLEVTFEITLNPKTHQIEHRLVNLYAQQGQRTGKRFEYGSNLLTVEREESAENLITALIGRGKGEAVYHEDNTAEETPDGYGRRINFADVVWSKKNGDPADKPAGQEYVEDVDTTAKYGFDDGKPRIGIEIFEDITDPAELLKATWSALQTLKRPQASFRASVMDVGDLGLGDTVAIVRHDIKIEYFTRVYKVTHNLLDERQNTIELGDDFSGSSIISTVNDLGKSVGAVGQLANYAAVSANGKNANYYGQAQPINPIEGDLWYKDLGNGETDMYQYHAGSWILITSTRDLRNVEKQVKQAQDDFTTAWNKAVAADSSAAKAQQRADDVGKQLQSAQADFDSKLSAASASASAANDKAMQVANAAQNDVNEQIKELNDYKSNAAKTYVAKGTVISNVNSEAKASIFSANNKLYMDAATTVFSGKAFIPDAAIIDLTASKLTAGTIDASKISVTNLNASNINTGSLNAGLIKVGSMSADRIVGGTLDFKNIAVSNLSAGSIVSGTLDAAKVSVINLNASNIKTGTLDASLIKAGAMSADRISGGTLDFSKVNAASLSADKITSGTLDAGNVNVINLNADNITSGTINGQNLKINLNTGEILFQKGKIASTNGLLNINVDDGTMSVTNNLNEGAFFKNGNIELTNFALWDKGDIPMYGKIAFAENMFELGNNGIEIQGKKGWIIHSENFDYNKFPLQYLWTMEKNGTSIGGNDQYIAMQAYSGISITAGAFLPHLESSLSESFKTAPYLNLGFNRDATYHNPAFVANSNAYEFSVDNTGTFMKYGRVYLNDSDYTYQFYVDLPWNSHIKLADDMGHDGRNAYFDVSVGGQTVIAFDNNGAYYLPKARTYIPNLTANSLTVTGSKNAIVPTSAGATLVNAYETAEYYFGDIGESTTDKKCVAQVTIDPLFLETVNTSVPYQVFVSSYDNATVWVESRTANIFVVRSSKPNVSFCWELKAKRKGYEHSRLEVDDSISAEDLRKAAKK